MKFLIVEPFTLQIFISWAQTFALGSVVTQLRLDVGMAPTPPGIEPAQHVNTGAGKLKKIVLAFSN